MLFETTTRLLHETSKEERIIPNSSLPCYVLPAAQNVHFFGAEREFINYLIHDTTPRPHPLCKQVNSAARIDRSGMVSDAAGFAPGLDSAGALHPYFQKLAVRKAESREP